MERGQNFGDAACAPEELCEVVKASPKIGGAGLRRLLRRRGDARGETFNGGGDGGALRKTRLTPKMREDQQDFFKENGRVLRSASFQWGNRRRGKTRGRGSSVRKHSAA